MGLQVAAAYPLMVNRTATRFVPPITARPFPISATASLQSSSNGCIGRAAIGPNAQVRLQRSIARRSSRKAKSQSYEDGIPILIPPLQILGQPLLPFRKSKIASISEYKHIRGEVASQ
jgi:hypothetical protein